MSRSVKPWALVQRPTPLRRGTPPRPGFSDELAYSAMVGDGIMALKDAHGSPCGPLLAGFWYEGPDVESSSWAELERIRYHTNAALRSLDAGWMVHFEAMRRVERGYLPGRCAAPVDQLINEERAANANYYVTDYAMFVCRAQRALDRPRAQKIQRLLLGDRIDEVVDEVEARIEAFEEAVTGLEYALSSAFQTVRRMRQREDNDELLQAVNYVVNGTLKRCKSPLHPVHLDSLLARDLVWSPEAMQFCEDEVSVVGLTNLPMKSVPTLLAGLSSLGLTYRWSTRFIALDYLRALGAMNSLAKRWKQKGDDDGFDRQVEIAEARKELEQREVRYGHYTSVIVLRERIEDLDDPKSRKRARDGVEDQARCVLKALQESGFEALIERRNRLEALLGSFPGHGVENLRKPMINTVNVADMIPLAREWTGSATAPCMFYPPKSPALMQARSWSDAPFFLNLHQGDVGHTAIFGPTGRGKSTLLGMLCSQFGRYPDSQVFVIDFGESMFALTAAHEDGVHYGLGGEDGPKLCPLAELDSAEDRAWAADWVGALCEEQKVDLTPELRGVIFRAVEELASSTYDAAHRTLSDYRVHLQHPRLNAVLDYYTTGVGGRVLNGRNDSLRVARFTTFETERLFGFGAQVARPTLRYLFRQIEKRLNGQPTFLVIDEAWLALNRFADKLAEWLKTLRKKNCAVILATQALSDVAQSPVADVVFENCPTKILLPNEQAFAQEELYAKKLQLNDAQIEALARAEGKRWYMYLSQGRSRMFSLDLGPVAKAFVGAGSREELAQVRALQSAYGIDWPSAWLAQRGLNDAAERYQVLSRRVR